MASEADHKYEFGTVEIPKGQKKKKEGCHHQFAENGRGGMIDGCIHCGKKYDECKYS